MLNTNNTPLLMKSIVRGETIVTPKKPLLIFLVLSTAVVFFTVLVGMVLAPDTIRIGPADFGDIDLSRIPDGTYYGSAEAFMARANVAVRVEDQQIVRIDLLRHIHSSGEEAEAVLDRVIAQQCLKVDVVAGATTSSLVLLKAVEDALRDEEADG